MLVLCDGMLSSAAAAEAAKKNLSRDFVVQQQQQQLSSLVCCKGGGAAPSRPPRARFCVVTRFSRNFAFSPNENTLRAFSSFSHFQFSHKLLLLREKAKFVY